MKVAVTGFNGFLGWHVRTVLFENEVEVVEVRLGNDFNLEHSAQQIEGADLLIHLAGANRGAEKEVSELNKLFATQISDALHFCKNPPHKVTYSNSIQAGNGTPYGDSKLTASKILQAACESLDISFVDVHIPNVFGEHGKPFYNSVTSTFCYQIANSGLPEVHENKELSLVHAQDVAEFLTGLTNIHEFQETFFATDVITLRDEVMRLAEEYSTGSIPDLFSGFHRNLFNTYRSYLFTVRPQIQLRQNIDHRGNFVEIVRSNSGGGQSSFSSTLPGVTRGEHFHRRKIERFTVLSGSGNISLRKMFTNEIVSFDVTGALPTAIDMPTLWTHNITNTGNELLLTSFWINESYDEANPDTVFEKVGNQFK